ncbi:hypothetical protein NEIELOOT_02660 [Neisseria elongata subsp. glycolytica ATCC 29315]|uniref:Uncharacterized protein n=1 Tax=Neisseria elongata subsp. glycolytica ATCC 29315 TaxID=546263 RepID=D4DUA2_NEIEG|nr:hypothetical protein NEIELOOT_02660 [Neisseria elongata subsp. glycolytica ATCC 29315]
MGHDVRQIRVKSVPDGNASGLNTSRMEKCKNFQYIKFLYMLLS